MQALPLPIDAGGFTTELELDPMLAVELLRIYEYAVFSIFAGEESFGQRRPFVWRRTVGRNNRKLAAFQATFDKLFRSITSDHSAAQNHIFRCVHAPSLNLQ